MDLRAAARVTSTVAQVFDALADLSTYPAWLGIVETAVPAPGADGERGPAWMVELSGRIGFVSRRKRVRMVRTGCDRAAATVRFERWELDGDDHNEWVLTGTARPAGGGGSEVAVHLHYGGGSTLPGADLLLRRQAERAGRLLEAAIAARAGEG